MKKGYKPSDRIYSDFEGDDNVAKSKLLWCKNCERWIPPPYIHTCGIRRKLSTKDIQEQGEVYRKTVKGELP